MRSHLDIVVDSNEMASKKPYIEYLRKQARALDQSVQSYQMSIGDIRIGDILIELKTPQDFISYQDGSIRVLNQAKRLTEVREQGYTVCVAIVGNFGAIIKRVGSKVFYAQKLPQYYGLINTLNWKWNVPVIQFKDNTHFQIWLKGVLKRQVHGRGLVTYSLRHTPSRIKGIKEEIHFILQGFKGLGGAKTDKIINSGGSNLFDILCEMAIPIYTDEISNELQLKSAQIIKKWEDLLGKKTYQHIVDVLTYELGEDK